MQRARAGIVGGFDSLVSGGRELFGGKRFTGSDSVLSTSRFRGKLGAAIAVITSLMVGFLTLPNNIIYLIDGAHAIGVGATSSNSSQERPDYEYAYIHAGIAVVTLGCLAMVVSIVLSFFAAKSKRKLDDSGGGYGGYNSTRTVLACLVVMNLELFLAVLAGCMELLYKPLIRDKRRLRNMETAIAAFNIIIYFMYVITMVLTSMVLKEKHGAADNAAYRRHPCEAVVIQPSNRDSYQSRSFPSESYM